MLHNHLFQCIAVAAALIVAFHFYMLWSDRQIRKNKSPAKVIDMSNYDMPEEYQTMWNVPEWKLGSSKEASKRIWEKINKDVCAEEN